MDPVLQLPGYGGFTLFHRGSQEVLYRGTADDGVRVVAKMVPSEVEPRRLLREAALLDTLHLPGVSRRRALVETPDGPVLVLVDAGQVTLESWLGARLLPVDGFLDLALQLAEIVGSVHQAGVIHRDVNPNNIIVDAAGSLTLVNFSLALRAPSVQADGSAAGRPVAALGYLAPEQTGRMNRALDRRADLYSLGAIFHRLLSGRPPFSGPDAAAVLHAHLARVPPRLDALRPEVPSVLADLVHRLLEKRPESRYQSAESLREDLLEARRQWLASGSITPFLLGRGDAGASLRLTERRYGGLAAFASLSRVFADAAAGHRVVASITGPSGSGKSTLARALLAQVTERGGRLASGKFEPLRASPFDALRAAFTQLIHGLSTAEREARRGPLEEALAENVSVLTALLPELATLLDHPAPPPALGPVETSNRFTLTVSRFIGVFARPESPLVLVFDDLQWADPASLALFEALAADETLGHLLLIGTWRLDGGRRPDSHLLARLAARGQLVHRIEVEPLDAPAVAEMLADAMNAEVAQTQALAALVHRKTGGSPLFVHRLLQHLARDGFIRWASGEWRWDLAAIELLPVTENVAALMRAELEALPDETRPVLAAAACLGVRASLDAIAAGIELPGEALRPALAPALESGLVLAQADGEGVIFAHDRVQQAAYEGISRAQAGAIHARLGRHLAQQSANLFAAADQLHLASEAKPGSVERSLVVEVNRRAGERAMATSAYRAAADYLERAIAALGADAWAEPAASLELFRQAAVSAWSAGEPNVAEVYLSRALEHTADPVERGELIRVRVMAACVRGEWRAAIDGASEVLEELGHPLPKGDAAAAFAAERAIVDALLDGRRPDALPTLPGLRDGTARAALELLGDLSTAFFFGAPELLPWAAAHMTAITIRGGAGKSSPLGLALYGMVLAGVIGDYEGGFAFGQVAVERAQRAGDPTQRCRTLHVVANHVHHWGAPLRTGERLFREAFAAGLQGGELEFAAFAANGLVVHEFHAGASLRSVLRDLEAGLAFARRGGHRAMTDIHWALQAALGRLKAPAPGASQFDHGAWRRSIAEDPPALGMEAVFQLQAAYLLGEFDEAQAHASEAIERRAVLTGLFVQAELPFYAGLTAAALGDRAALDTHRATLDALAAACPANIRHKALLLTAERDRLAGATLDAMAGYDAAIAGAAREGFLQDEGLANRQAAVLYRALGRHRIATMYARAAAEAWHRWGASALQPVLEAHWPELALEGPMPRDAGPTADTHDASQPDLATVLEAAEAITDEVDLDRLLQKLMAVCVEAAGATRGVLVVEEAEGPFVRAIRDTGEEAGGRLCRVALARSQDLPVALVVRAAREGETIVADDVLQDALLAQDPYVVARAPRSLMVLPIFRQATRIAVLYFENVLTPFAFTPRRARLLRMLSTEIAISLHNGLLFTELARENERRQAVALELASTNEELETFVHSLSHDLKRLARTASSCLEIVLEEGGGHLDEDTRELTTRARRAMLEVTPLLESLLRYSRIGQQAIVRTDVDVSGLAERTIRRFRVEAPERQVEVRIEPGLRVSGDEPLLGYLLEVLLENAWTFTAGCAAPRIEVGRRGETLFVRDTGVGFDARFADKLFKPFQRIHAPGDFRGVGLGLATARRIVEKHQGEIGAESVPGQGTEFWFRLYRAP